MPAQTLGSLREQFDVPAEVAYFHTANLAPLTHRVRAAGEAALERRAQPWTIGADDWFSDVERLRGLFAELVGADADGIALIPATSYGFALATPKLGLGSGDRILVLAAEYPSGIYSWRRIAAAVGAEIVTVERRDDESWTDAILAALHSSIAVVSAPNVHWTDGALVDLGAIAARCRETGARLVVDASQSAGAMPLDIGALRPDFLFAVGYKWLLGPLGLSFAYVAPEHRDGVPLEENWINRANSDDFAALALYEDAYQPGARRYDVGQRTSFQLVPMAIAALEQLLEWRVERVVATLAATTATLAARIGALGYTVAPAEQRGPHMLGVGLAGVDRGDVAARLAGANCFAGVRGDSLRLAPHLHVNDADVERLVGALAAAHG